MVERRDESKLVRSSTLFLKLFCRSRRCLIQFQTTILTSSSVREGEYSTHVYLEIKEQMEKKREKMDVMVSSREVTRYLSPNPLHSFRLLLS